MPRQCIALCETNAVNAFIGAPSRCHTGAPAIMDDDTTIVCLSAPTPAQAHPMERGTFAALPAQAAPRPNTAALEQHAAALQQAIQAHQNKLARLYHELQHVQRILAGKAVNTPQPSRFSASSYIPTPHARNASDFAVVPMAAAATPTEAKGPRTNMRVASVPVGTRAATRGGARAPHAAAPAFDGAPFHTTRRSPYMAEVAPSTTWESITRASAAPTHPPGARADDVDTY